MENKTIEELLEELIEYAIDVERAAVLQDFHLAMNTAQKGVSIQNIILKRFSELEEYKFMYEWLEK